MRPLRYPCGKLRPTRRQFVTGALATAGAASLGCLGRSPGGATNDAGNVGGTGGRTGPTTRKTAADRVILGSTGIEVSRLALGTGTHGVNGASDQTRLGMPAFLSLFTHGFTQGLTFFETADQYGAHPFVKEAIRQVGRQNVVVLTKTHARTKAEMEADLARFRTELGVDMIDIVLLHYRNSATWTTEAEGAMEVLSTAKQAGAIRAHGVSCHTIEALRLAAKTPWVDIDLARLNPDQIHMDADPATVISVLNEMKAAGKGVIGMKILGEGQLGNRLDRAIGHAVAADSLDAFTIGFTSTGQLDQVVQKIESV